MISTLNGVLFGMLLFLMASGLTVIFSMLGVLNFAHASFYMLGAFFGFQISRWLGSGQRWYSCRFSREQSELVLSALVCGVFTKTDM